MVSSLVHRVPGLSPPSLLPALPPHLLRGISQGSGADVDDIHVIHTQLAQHGQEEGALAWGKGGKKGG